MKTLTCIINDLMQDAPIDAMGVQLLATKTNIITWTISCGTIGDLMQDAPINAMGVQLLTIDHNNTKK